MALSTPVQERLSMLNAEFNALFNAEFIALVAERQLTKQLSVQIQLVQDFYHEQLTDSASGDKNQPLLNHYKTLVDTLQLVRAGQLTAEQAIQNVDATACSQKLAVVVHNLLNACQMLFWLTTALTCYFVSIAIGIPGILIQPFIGIPLTVGSFHSANFSLYKTTTCIDEFKSFAKINHENQRERNLIGFFAPSLPSAGNALENPGAATEPLAVNTLRLNASAP